MDARVLFILTAVAVVLMNLPFGRLSKGDVNAHTDGVILNQGR